MLIDWFTVAAQALNFVILVWLMKRFLYMPILDALDARETRIAAELADADVKKADAQKQRDEYEHKNQQFDQQRAGLLAKAIDEAKAERQRLLDDARQAADVLSAKRFESLKTEAKNLDQAVLRRAQAEVFAIARKALTDLAGTELEQRITEVFVARLRQLQGPAKSTLADALKTASDPALLRGAFELPAAQRATIQEALNQTFAAKIPLRFETAPALIGGIELSCNGQKLAWSIADYLASLQQGVDEVLRVNTNSEARSEANPESKPAPQVTGQTELEPDAETAPAAKVEAKAKPKTDPDPKAAKLGAKSR